MKRVVVCRAGGLSTLVTDAKYEKEVFGSFSFKEFKPKMLIVELCDIHEVYNNYSALQKKAQETRQHILANGYKEIFKDCINKIF